MESFRIKTDQIVSIIGALVAEEANAVTERRFDSLTTATWNADTALDGGEVSLTANELDRCRARVCSYFDLPDGRMRCEDAETLGAWAECVKRSIEDDFRCVRFVPAGGFEQNAFCEHAIGDVFVDAAAAANLLYGRRRVVSLVAPHSIMGLTLAVLTPNLQKIPTLDARTLAPDALRNALQFGDALVATPTLWRYIIQQNVSAPDNAMGVYFGEPMSAELSAEMRQAGFGAQREIYGSTETGLVGWRDAPTDPFVLFDHWVRHEDGLGRTHADGSVQAVSPMDVLSWVDDRRFVLSGRRDGALQIGAVNVFPRRIAEAIIEHPLVDDCEMRAARQNGGANRLIAHIQLKAETPPTERTAREIDQWCRRKLRPQERPSIFHFEAALEHVRHVQAGGV